MPDLRLELLTPDHVPALQEMVDDPLIGAYTPIPVPPPPDQAARMVQAYAADDAREGYGVLDGAGALLAFGMLGHIDRTAQQCELGYMVGRDARGRGVATQTLRLLVARALDLGMHRLELRISAGNAASERVAERNGFTREGVLRQLYLKPGVRVDTSIWSRLATDPSPA